MKPNFAKTLQAKRAREKEEVKKFFVETGEFEKIQKLLKKKRKSKVSINELPF